MESIDVRLRKNTVAKKKHPASNCIFKLVETGLVLVEPEFDHFCIFRPASLDGTEFWSAGHKFSNSGTGKVSLRTNAPMAYLSPESKNSDRWIVDISSAAASGPGPIWFHETFESVEEAVKAVEDCFFGDLIDFTRAELKGWY